MSAPTRPAAATRAHGTLPPRATALMLAIAAALGGCASPAPRYEPPAMPVPAAFRGAPAHGASWLPANLDAGADRGAWWTLFDDPELDRLAGDVAISNQTAAVAAAAYDEARALVREQRAALFPSISADASARRSGGRSAGSPSAALQLGLSAGWEPDLWGRLRSAVTVASASAEASAADLAAARLSVQAELAANYFSLRAADAEIGLLQTTVEGYERSLQITRNRYEVGVIARTDVLQAEVQLTNTRAELIALEAQRLRLEHAIATLTGRAPADFVLARADWTPRSPAIPLAVPSLLLQRRPDIAATERDVAAANAAVGVQRAASFPSISLTASLGQAASGVSGLFGASSALWALGVALVQPVFDAGAIAARVEGAEARREAAIARYRQTVLVAFQEVEDQLTSARTLAEQQVLRRAASAAADAIESQVMNRYRAGQLSYTEVVTAQIAALNARRALLQLALERQVAAIALIRALGGGWQAPAPS